MPIQMNEEAQKYKDLGNQSFKKKNYEEAIQFYKQAIDICPDETSLYTNSAACLLQLSKYEDAIYMSEKAIKVDPKFIKGYFRLGQSYLALGKLYEAKREYEKGLKMSPKEPTLLSEIQKIEKIEKHIQNVKHYKEKELFDNALAEIEYALLLSPQSIPFQLEKSEILIDLKKYSEASKVSGNILKSVQPNNSDAMFIRGKALFYQGMSKESSHLLLTALQYDPDNIKCLKFRKKIQEIEKLKKEGNDLFQNNSLKEAYDKYTDAIKIDPNASSLNSQIYCNRSAVAMKMNDYKLAAKDASTAIDLNPEYVKAYIRRAAAYEKLENYQEAVYDLNKAKELDPENRNVNSNLKDLQKKAKSAKRKDYYKILGISKDASEEEISKAYKKGCAMNHPDRFVDEDEKKEATLRFQDIGEANEVLSDPKKRRQYDSGADLNDINSGGGGNPFGGMDGVDISDIFSMFGGGMGGGMGGGNPFGGGMGGGMGGGFHSFSFGGDGGGFQRSSSSRRGRKRY
eukprot:gene3808-6969_t